VTVRFYNIFRWYRPRWGRYTQTDPLGVRSSSVALYAYSDDAPINKFDALGLFAMIERCIIRLRH
jgi:RHS repeat-associated protein